MIPLPDDLLQLDECYPGMAIADQLRAYADAVRADEREKWISGVKISIPTEAMEREIDAHVRRAVAKERERCADICNRAMPNPVMNLCDAQIVEALRQCAEAIRNYRAQDKAV